MSSRKEKQRPVLELPLSGWEKGWELLALIGIFVLLFLVCQWWEVLPQRIPTHFGAGGEPDAWGSKSSLLIIAIVAIATYGLLTIFNRYPHTFNYLVEITEANAEEQYRMARQLMAVLKVEITWMFAYIQWIIIQIALGKASGLGSLFLLITMIVLLGSLGVYFYKVSRMK